MEPDGGVALCVSFAALPDIFDAGKEGVVTHGRRRERL